MVDEPEEIPMNEVLSSIRHMLSDEAEQKEPLDVDLEDIFVLTPAMRVPKAEALTIQDRMKLALKKLAEQKVKKSEPEYQALVKAELQPILKDWLKEQLPSLIEKALDEEMTKLFG